LGAAILRRGLASPNEREKNMSWLRFVVFGLQTFLQLGATYSPFLGPFANTYFTNWDLLLSGILAFSFN